MGAEDRTWFTRPAWQAPLPVQLSCWLLGSRILRAGVICVFLDALMSLPLVTLTLHRTLDLGASWLCMYAQLCAGLLSESRLVTSLSLSLGLQCGIIDIGDPTGGFNKIRHGKHQPDVW